MIRVEPDFSITGTGLPWSAGAVTRTAGEPQEMEGREQPGREGVVERRTPGGFVWRAEGTLNTRYFRAPAEPLGSFFLLVLYMCRLF